MTSFPSSVWDGSTPNRSREDDVKAPDAYDFMRIREEIQAVQAVIIKQTHVLENEVAKDLLTLEAPAGGSKDYVIKVIAGSDVQVVSGTVHYAAADDAGEAVTDTPAVSATDGTVEVEFGFDGLTLQVTVSSSLTPDSMEIVL